MANALGRAKNGQIKKLFCKCNDSFGRACSFKHDYPRSIISGPEGMTIDDCPDCHYIPWYYIRKEDEPK